MKNLISLIGAVMLSALSAGAMAYTIGADGTVKVETGESWSSLFGGSYERVQDDPRNKNVVRKNDVLYVGDRINLPEGVKMAGTKAKALTKVVDEKTIEIRPCPPCRLDHFNEDAFRNSGRDPVEALVKHHYPRTVAQELVAMYEGGKCVDYTIKSGEKFIMMMGKTRDLVGAIHYTGVATPAKLCVAKTGERAYIPEVCANWAMKSPEDVKPVPVPAVVRVPEVQVVAPVQSVPAAQQVQTIALLPSIEVVAAAETVLPVKSVASAPAILAPIQIAQAMPVKPLKRTCSAYEVNAGVDAWQNDLADGNGVWGEVGCWHQFEKSPEYSWLIGLFGSNAPGESRISSYEWDESKVALQAGLQRTWLNDKAFLSQWQAKIRLGREWQEGGSPDAYHMKQRNALLGWYGEIFEEINARGDRLGVMTSGWTDLSSKRTSNAVGWTDKPESRFTAEILGFYERSLDENWKVRPLAGFMYTGWDEMWWMRLIGEFSYTTDDGVLIAFGPYANLPIGDLSKSYPGVDKSDLDTFGVFARVELGEAVRRHEGKVRTAEFCREYNVNDCPVNVEKVLGTEKQADASSAKAPATEGWDLLNLGQQIKTEEKVSKVSTVEQTVGEGFTFGF